MLSASQSIRSIIADLKAMKAHEAHEAAISTNKGWVSASQTKVKRDAPEHTPLEGNDPPETYFSLTERTLHGIAQVVKARRVRMEQGSREVKAPVGSDEWEKRRKAALREENVSPIEVAFIFGYTSDRALRELRIRNGLNEHTGVPLQDRERPIISDRKRARR